jgi:hypothetical protein
MILLNPSIVLMHNVNPYDQFIFKYKNSKFN